MNTKDNSVYLYAAIIVTLGGFLFGLDIALISGTFDYLKVEFGLSEFEKGVIASASAWGALIAQPLTSVVSEKFGRKNSLLIVAIFYFSSAIYSVVAGSAVDLFIARFIGGLAYSSLTLASMYVGEISPAHLRGKLVSLNQINISIGVFVAFFANYLIVQSASSGSDLSIAMGLDIYTWRWMLGVEILPAFIWFCLLFMIPESPYWLVSKRRIPEARKVLQLVLPRSEDGSNREVEIAQKVESIEMSTSQNGVKDSVVSQLKELFTPRMRKILIIGVSVALAQQVIGVNAIKFYAPNLFEQLAIGRDSAFFGSIWVGVFGMCATLLSLLFIDKSGRRPIAIEGMATMVLCLGICTYGFKSATYSVSSEAIVQMEETIPDASSLKVIEGQIYETDVEFKSALKEVMGEQKAYMHSGTILQKCTNINSIMILIAIMVFVATYSFSLGPIVWVLISEIVPTSLRSGVIPFFALMTSLGSALVQSLFPWQLDVMGAGNTFMIYMVCGASLLVVIYFNLIETKNKTIEEIEDELIIKN